MPHAVRPSSQASSSSQALLLRRLQDTGSPAGSGSAGFRHFKRPESEAPRRHSPIQRKPLRAPGSHTLVGQEYLCVTVVLLHRRMKPVSSRSFPLSKASAQKPWQQAKQLKQIAISAERMQSPGMRAPGCLEAPAKLQHARSCPLLPSMRLHGTPLRAAQGCCAAPAASRKRRKGRSAKGRSAPLECRAAVAERLAGKQLEHVSLSA